MLCDGPMVGTTTITAGTCQAFQSASSMALAVGQWQYVGFSYDTFTKRGTFIINRMHGYQAVLPMENQYFSYNTKQWLSEGSKAFK